MKECESCAIARPMREAPTSGEAMRQAAFATATASLLPWISSRISVAMHTQLPQPAPQPVRMVSSDMLRQPLCAVWRISRSVTPLQRQTYMADGAVRWERFPFRHG
jgi:hypothetical protein